MEKCPQCGYVERSIQVRVVNDMYQYVDLKTGKVDGVYNHDAEKLEIKNDKGQVVNVLVRSDKYKPEVKTETEVEVKK